MDGQGYPVTGTINSGMKRALYFTVSVLGTIARPSVVP